MLRRRHKWRDQREPLFALTPMTLLYIFHQSKLGDRPVVGRQALNLFTGVRILLPQPVSQCRMQIAKCKSQTEKNAPFHFALCLLTCARTSVPSSSGLGRWPLTPETRVRFPLGPPFKPSSPPPLPFITWHSLSHGLLSLDDHCISRSSELSPGS